MTASTQIDCTTCTHACHIPFGGTGLCKARSRSGAENYGRITAIALDPIEKKPLARFHPGTTVLSVGSYGCNMSCPWCQNNDISCAGSKDVAWHYLAPTQLVSRALQYRSRACIGLAFTYNEPLIGWEYVRDCGQIAHDAGLLNVLVSNGVCAPEVLEEVAPLLDAANIDLKAFNPKTYERCGGNLDSVKHTIETLAHSKTCHLEVTTLVIPGVNDSAEEIDAAANWLASLDTTIPYHLTRFFPRHHMLDTPATPVATLEKLAGVARRHLSDVTIGNV